MGALETITYSLLCIEMFAVMAVVLTRRCLSARWQQKILRPFPRFGLIKNASVPLLALSMLFVYSHRRVKELDARKQEQGSIEHSVMLQNRGDLAWAQRNMYISLIDLYLAVLLWLILGINDETQATPAIRPDGPAPVGRNASKGLPTTQSSTAGHPRFRVTIKAPPTTSSAMNESNARRSPTTNTSLLHPSSSASLAANPRGLREIEESMMQQASGEALFSTGNESEENDSISTDPRSHREIQNATIHSPTTSSTRNAFRGRGGSATTNVSRPRASRSESPDTDPWSLKDMYEARLLENGGRGSSDGSGSVEDEYGSEEDESLHTDSRRLRRRQNASRRGRGDFGSSTGFESE
ncbi:hypothetical protein Vi05172_g1780 [Venturia inaequalis]|nr:hypothetical protein Vi05172_g1780 [Venturia inaequalis]